MPTNGGPGIIKIPAKIYPGMFEGEVQVTVEIGGEEINLIVSVDFVDMPEENLTDDGVAGELHIEIVEKIPSGYLVHLPGEVQGASNRAEYAPATQ